jgi:hypothetical protein
MAQGLGAEIDQELGQLEDVHPPAPGDEGSADGLFSSLADTKDWASAAAKWAEGGFSAEEMPSFIEDQPVGAGEVATQPEMEPGMEPEPDDEVGEDEPIVGELVTARVEESAMAVEVSDTDIMMVEETEPGEGEEPLPDEPTSPERAPAPQAGRKKKKPKREPTEPVIRLKKKAETRRGLEAKDRKKKPSRLSSPAVIIPAVAVVILAAGGLIWFLSGDSLDPEGAEFSADGLNVTLVQAPAPLDYSAKDDAIEHYGQGNQYAFEGRFEDAILEYEEALRIDPDYPHPHRALGAVYAALGKPKLSKTEYEAYLKLVPRGADAEQVRKIIDFYGQ